MYFNKDERVFSLSGTSGVVLHGDTKSLWSELFCYLLIAGFYTEGQRELSPVPVSNKISDKDFFLYNESYHHRLGRLISEGLKARHAALRTDPYLNERERMVLDQIDGLFEYRSVGFNPLSGKSFLAIAISRGLDPDMVTIAHYASVMYGQFDFPNDTYLNKLYISIFGNIHLVNPDRGDAKIKVTAPKVRFNEVIPKRGVVSPFWAFMSSLTDGYAEMERGGQLFMEDLANYSLLAEKSLWDSAIPLPRVCGAANVAFKTGVDEAPSYSLVAQFYHNFLYGSVFNIDIIRHGVFRFILDHMVKTMGESHPTLIVPPTSIYQKIIDSRTIRTVESKRSILLNYALEALDAELDPEASDSEKKTSSKKDDNPEEDIPPVEEDPETDPSTEDGGFDPGTPPPTVPSMDKDTIELIPRDKTGEGLDEDLYRSAVVVLNDRLKSDDSIVISADVKDELDQWVNGYLYRAAISVTKDRIKNLGLQKYLKKV